MQRRRVLPLTVLLLLAIGLHAQVTSTAPLSGTVTDQTGSVVPGTAVTVQNMETGTTYKAVTGANGTFNVPALSTGTYSVLASAKGFKQATVANIKLDVGVPASVMIRL